MLTLYAIAHAKPKAKPYKLADGDGLHLFVKPSGSKIWRLKYRFAGKEKLLSFGSFPEVTAAAAREKCRDARKTLASGVDPAEKKRDDKIAVTAAAQDTFGTIAGEVLAKAEARGAAEATMAKKSLAPPGPGRASHQAAYHSNQTGRGLEPSPTY